ncbi:MAG: SEC-C metal-binding domain-containing protein [Planctomycetota bacterium]
MPAREITLEAAAFLDSSQAKALAAPDTNDVRKIVDAFLACAYDEIGKAPRFLDGEDMHGIVGHLLPSHFGRKDPLAEHVVPVLSAYVDFLTERAVVSQAFEVRRALADTASEFEEVVRTGAAVHHHGHHERQAPFVHKASKTGRNDPCPCGSQKKFKNCCARLGT